MQHSQKPTHFTNFPANMFLVDVRKNICTVPFLDAQELHSRSTWKANVCTFLYISVRKFFSVRNLSLVGGMGLNNFLEAAHCLCLKKRFKMFNFNWNFWKFLLYFSILILPLIALKRWNFSIWTLKGRLWLNLS